MKRIFLVVFSIFSIFSVDCQRVLTLWEAIELAREGSPDVQVSELLFMSRYWNYRSYKAELLPSFSLNGTVGNYNRSLVQVQDYYTGDIKYFRNNTMSNSLGLSLTQNIPFTGGTLSLNTDLYRLDQFTGKTVLYNSRPMTINYVQPLRTYNELKWLKRTAPREYEQAKRNLLESIENITMNVTTFFFESLRLQVDYDKAVLSAEDNQKLYEIAQHRYSIGSITKSDLLQMELSMHQSDLAVNDSKVAYDMAINNLCMSLGLHDIMSLELIPPGDIPDRKLDYEQVLDLALENSSLLLEHELRRLNALKQVAQAKSQRGPQVTFSANLGLSQSSDKFGMAYRDLKDQEVMSVTLSMPIFDWGMSRGRVKMAQAQERLVQTEVEQDEFRFSRDLLTKVLRFNNQREQCEISRMAMEVADERYKIAYQLFANGSITALELNIAQNEQKTTANQYVTQLGVLWSSYFEIRKLTLYDFIEERNISADFDKIIN